MTDEGCLRCLDLKETYHLWIKMPIGEEIVLRKPCICQSMGKFSDMKLKLKPEFPKKRILPYPTNTPNSHSKPRHCTNSPSPIPCY